MAKTLPWLPGLEFVGPEDPGFEEATAEHNLRRDEAWEGDRHVVLQTMERQCVEDGETEGD